jgi:hypothetical protein
MRGGQRGIAERAVTVGGAADGQVLVDDDQFSDRRASGHA